VLIVGYWPGTVALDIFLSLFAIIINVANIVNVINASRNLYYFCYD
jgi:hypothetical protein